MGTIQEQEVVRNPKVHQTKASVLSLLDTDKSLVNKEVPRSYEESLPGQKGGEDATHSVHHQW